MAVSAYKHILSMMHYYKTYRAKNKKLLLAALMLCFGTVATAQVQVKGSVFGGGNLANVGGNSSVKVSQNGAKISKDVYGGGALANVVGTATVQIDSGTVDSNVYGGGLGRKASSGVSAIAATVGGVVHVSIGSGELGDDGNPTNVKGDATIGGAVFGCNNLNGSPKNNVYVDIWKTAHTEANEVDHSNVFASMEAFQQHVSHIKDSFALQAVYGGGNEATYLPTLHISDADTIPHTIQVHIHGCANTVKMVYGGGCAADAGCANDPGTDSNEHIAVKMMVIVDGGRIDTLFGGGDGHTLAEGHSANSARCANHTPANNDTAHHYRAADIYGDASAFIHGGYFTAAFAGSNTAGDIIGGTKSLSIDKDGPCATEDEFIITLFGGANEAITHGDVELTVGCGVGDIGELYGGSNKAEIIDGDVTLNIRGGSFTDVFGGSRGVAGNIAANIHGNVTLNLYGGTIVNAYGGSDKNGNITGTITVNVLDHQGICPLHVDTIYGGGNLTFYKPTDTTIISPVVNVIHINDSIKGSVFGGAKGSSAKVTANPLVNFGYKSSTMSSLIPQGYTDNVNLDTVKAYVKGNVFGGGNAGPVVGNTVVLVQNGSCRADTVFGGGCAAGVSGTATVEMSTGLVAGALFGGCDASGSVDSTVIVKITGGTIGTENVSTADVVFGGGFGPATNTGDKVKLTISGNPTIWGNVYGGSAKGNVNSTTATDSTLVTLTSGTLHGDLYGGGLGDNVHAAAVNGPVLVTVQGGSVNNVFGCNNANGAPQSTVAVNINTGASISQNVFGGGNEAGAAVSPTVTINGGTVTGNVFGGGNEAGVGASSDITLVTVKGGSVLSGVYGGCNTSGTVTGKDSVSIVGGAIGANTRRANIYGGGLGTGTRMKGDVRVTVNTSGSISGDVYGGSAMGKTNCNEAGDAHEGSTQTLVTLAGGTINGNLYGGGHGPGNAEANVYGPVTVVVAAGTVDSVFGCNNVNGAPQSTDTVKINGGTVKYVFGGGNVANYGGEAVVTVNGGTVSNSIFGGGNAAGVGSTHVIIDSGTIGNIAANTITTTNYGGVYGGCNVSGAVTGNIVVDVLGGTFGTQAAINAEKLFNIFGGGYGSATSTTGNVTVNYGSDNGTPKLYGDLYGGSALGSVNANAANTTTVNLLNGSFGQYSKKENSIEYRYGGSIYGGGLGEEGTTSEAKAKGQVNGTVQVNVGAYTDKKDPSTYTGNVNLEHCSVYGCNNTNGSPQGDVYVDVYSTYHETGKNDYASEDFAIENVYGGGNKANYQPVTPDGGHSVSNGAKTHVFVHGCANTVKYVYGGGNAADAVGAMVEIEGGHFGDVFGGGNGLVTPANVGAGGAGLAILSGRVNYQYEGCNMQGNITGAKYNILKNTTPTSGYKTPPTNLGVLGTLYNYGDTVLNAIRPEGYFNVCDTTLTVETWFFGGNEAEIYTGLENTITCEKAGKFHYKNVYAGSRHASIYGDVKLTVEGGEIGNLFGGSRGYETKPAHIKKHPTQAQLNADMANYTADPTNYKLEYSQAYRTWRDTVSVKPTPGSGGNIVLTVRGGTIGNIYGGVDRNGNVEGSITINIESNNSEDCPLSIDNIYGGSNLAEYRPLDSSITSPIVNIKNGVVGRDDLYVEGEVHGCVFGGGKGDNDYMDNGVVTSNPKVLVQPGSNQSVWVKGNIYGGGYLASVGKFTRREDGFPTACAPSTGKATVEILGGKVGPAILKMPDFRGHVFGGGKGIVNENSHTPTINFVNTTEVIIGGTAFVKGSVYGGAENGHVLDSTYVKIQGGQIGAGYNYSTQKNEDPYTTWNVDNPLAECHHWPYKAPYAPYDKFATAEGKYSDSTSSNGGLPASGASDGHTFYGNVFGGGSGYFPYAPGKWLWSAGAVYGNTRVEITGGHILTSVYGGNELTNVDGKATVIMSGGSLGVPRTEDSITKHPVTCYLFGGGKGDQRVNFNEQTNVGSTQVTVSGGKIWGSIFGGAEDGHVMGNAEVIVKDSIKEGNTISPVIGTRGTSYVDGNVFGGGRGFSGEALTAGVVCGNIKVNILGGTMLGSIFGGGRLASVGTFLTPPDDINYGKMQSGDDHGFITVNISGGTIGNDSANATHGGKVFGGCMGRLKKQDDNYNPLWPGLAHAKKTKVTISGNALIKRNVYGGGEFGFVDSLAVVNIGGGTVDSNVYGGGYGSLDNTAHKNLANKMDASNGMTAKVLAGRVYNRTEVNITGGSVANNVYGGGEMASVGDENNTTIGNTVVNIGAVSGSNYSGNATIGGNVYGANNIAGSPFGNTRVNIYGTARTTKQEATCSGNDCEYAIAGVFGGGREADYAPKNDNKRAYVHIYGCENTIKNFFGGGDAAAVYGAKDTIDGGRFHFVFGGGNGEVTKADIGAGGTGLVVQAGIIDSLFGGSNKKGSIYGPVNTVLNHEKSSCTEQIGVFFAGSNEANIGGSLTTDIVCGVDTIGEIYGGCHLADIAGNVKLNISGGKFHYVFGGSKGKAGNNPADSANIGGTVTLNIYGGQIDTAFGGSNVNGNIGKEIIVNVEDTSNTCSLKLKGVYGGGKDAAHTPSVATLASPIVNIKHGTVSGDVNGGGLGTNAVVTAHPKVYIGDDNTGHTAIVKGKVFGGGEAAEVQGTTYVQMKNANSRVDTIFGGGYEADVSGLATVRILGGTVRHDVYGGGALSKTGGTYVALRGGTITEDLYGGGHGKKAVGNDASTAVGADVEGNVTVYDSLGTVRNVYGCNNQHGFPTGTVNVYIYNTVTGNVYGGGNEADAKILTSDDATKSYVTFVTSGAYAQNVFGGGHAAATGFSTVTINGGTVAKGVYGGCESSGDVKFDAVVNLNGGQVGTSTNRADGVFGGGLGISTGVVNHVTVNYTNGTLYGDLYGGSSLGTVNTTNSNCTTAVNVVGGTIDGNIYGGGKGQSGQSYGQVNGKIIVNIGRNNSKKISGVYTRDYQGSANISGSIFGCNNAGGTPKDNVEVNVYATNQSSSQEVNDTAANVDDERFAIDQVFGGGNEADYSPDEGKSITTHIYGCNNTIRRVFGGSNAAHATSVSLIIDGGRFGHVYAGGNGETTQANITQSLYMGRHGGRYGSFTVQGNNLATVPANYTLVQNGDSCGVTNIGDYFCGNDNGSNNNPINRTIRCGEFTKVKNLYGGCNKGHQTGDITLTIEGGEIDNVFGGCKGTQTTPANVNGNITLTIKGGTIKNVFGGCNINGNVTGTITVNVIDGEDGNCPLILNNVYGGGREAHYQPTTAGLYPKVNIYHLKEGNSVKGNVYGGGWGSSAYVQTNPVVSIGDSNNTSNKVKVDGCIYGGGEEAEVRGNTTVNIKNASTTVDSNVFGGGNLANVTGNVDIVIGNNNAGPIVNGDVYGGGALAHTGTSGNTDATTYHNNVSLYNGTVNGNVYGGGLGDGSHAAAVYSPVNVKVYGGQADTVFGCNNIAGAPQSTVNVDIYGTAANIRNALKAVFGGGNQADASVSPVVTIRNNNCSTKNIGVVYGGGNAAQVAATSVTVYGGSIDTVFGGGNGKVKEAPVAGASTVKIHGGSIGQVFGGNNVNGNIKDAISVTIEQKGEGNNHACTMEVGNVYGGGNLAVYAPSTTTAYGKDKFSPKVSIISGNIVGSVYGGGKGIETSETSLTAGMVRSNTLVDMQGGTVKHSIYGGGELASVGDINSNYDGCKSGTGLTKVLISGGVVGDINNARMPSTTDPEGDEFGYVFAGGKGVVDSATYEYANKLALVDSTYLEISDSALITASVYGGCENGMVLRNTHVKISGGQIGTGHYTTKEGNTVTHHWDAAYSEEQWTAAKNAVVNDTMGSYISSNPFHECDHFPFGVIPTGGDKPEYNVYDIYAGEEDYNPEGASEVASNGHSFYGNVFGGGSGYYPFWDATKKKSVWRRTAGRVNGNTLVEITGGHILTGVYGGNEYTDVLGHSTVKMSGGTLGVPRSLDSIAAHPVTCYLFGAGMGDPRAEFNTWTTVDSVYVEVSGGIIYGSVFGGGEDGHVKGNANVVVKDNAIIGTWGTSYVDGNVFGGGRGFKGDVLTPGVVAGNVTVDIQGGTMLGSIYGGGRLASVGTHLVDTNDSRYGKIQDGEKYGHITINISGGTIGNNNEYIYVAPGTTIDAGWRASHNLPLTEFDENNRVSHTKGGNVFGGCMGRIYELDGTTKNPIWSRLAVCKETRVNISGNAIIKSSVYGGGEIGTVNGSVSGQDVAGHTYVTVTGGTIGSPVMIGNSIAYYCGSIFGGGYGSEDLTIDNAVDSAGRVFGTTVVTLKGGTVRKNVFGGGDLATVTGSTTVTVTGGTVGPLDGTNLNGNVYGAGKGKPSDNYRQYCNVERTYVTIKGGEIKGDVYGGGADAHVIGHTSVLIDSVANIGTDGLTNYDGNVFGGGRGSGHYKIANDRSSFIIDTTCGRVGGNTSVTMKNGAIKGSLFGGGRMALVGIETSGKPDFLNGNVYDSINHGMATINISGGHIGNPDGDALLASDFSIGDIFGSGKGDGIDSTDVLAGRVMNTKITINGNARIYGSVFGGGEMAGIGWWETDGTFISKTGSSTITVNGCDSIGTLREFDANYIAQHGDWTTTNQIGRLVHSCTGNVIGGSQGDAATTPYEGTTDKYKRHWVSMGRSRTATVTIGGGHILGEVFGGAEQGTVRGNTRVNINGGIIGTLIGTGSDAYYFGSVYGGGYGSNDVSEPHNDSSMRAVQIAGRVYGNTSVAVTNGTVKANVYGGGSYASVGNLTFGTTDNMPTACNGGGTAVVSIIGGTIEGSVFGSSRGDVVELDQKLDDQAWTDSTSVTINTGAQVKGNVFGGGENGHVRGNTFVNIKGGTIGIAAADYNTNVSATEFGQCGNVYGAGSGMDKIDGKYNPKGGIVMGNTKVTVEGGYISRNVYGAGAMASVGTASIDKEHRDSTKTFAFSWPYKYTHVDGTGDAVVTITGGHIGTAANPTLSGDVYGSARGEAGDRYVFNRLANVRTATVTVNYDSPSDNITGDNVIVGSVYGSGENGHVYDSTIVTLENGLVGGSVFGGGKGTDTYLTRLKNPENEQWYDTYERSITAGKVYGNTHVTINGGTVKHSVYGGGNLASVGKGNYDGYGEKHANTDDSLLVENSGHCYVNVYGGTIGVDDENNNGHVFGSSKGIPFKTINKNPRINYSRDFFLAYSNKTTVTIGENTTTTGPHVYGSVFGGGENGHVRLDTWVRINSGEVGIDLDTNITKTSTDLNALTNSSKWIYRGNVFGAGRGMDTTADGQYCSSAGSVTRNTLVDINGGKIYRNVHGGGSLASVGPPPTYTTEISTCTVNINAAVGASTAPISGKNAYAHYGGYVGGASRGLPGLQFAGFATCKNSVVNINEGANVRNTVYGGGENGQVLGNTQVNINGGYVRASVYGGGKGSWQDTTLDVNCRHCYDNDTISGRVKGNTEVNLLGGSVQWVYGGCSRALVDGDATVNVGDSNLSCAGVTFHGSTHGGVYGSNQYVGSPKGDIHVNIYKTAHTATDSAIFVGTAPTTPTYAIGKVIGGGYQANYEPKDGKQIYLNIYTCDNTIQDVYGGGDAASVTNTTTIIRGGRFDRVFGGGNGTSSPAHVTGTSNLTITAGQIHQLFGGSNSQGSVNNSIVTISHDSTSCPEDIDEYFGGGNEADITGDIATTIECGAKFRSVYGGSNKADITGNVTLNINGGTIDNVYGGSKGETDPGESARQGLRDTAAANITGNVTLNIYGGTIKRAFGGSNINGNITGKIMVNVDWSQSNCAGKQLDTVFGASNLAAYSPSSSLNSPEVNLIHATVKDVFGAGKGESAKASANANPKVTIGDDLSNTDKQAIVTGSVFGGGDLADVGGVTTVTVQKKNSEVKYVYGGGNADTVGGTQVFVTSGKVDYLFGGGKGDNNSGAKAKVDGNDTIAITGGRILKAFGGSNLNGDITGRVHLRVEKSTDSLFIGEVYGGGNYAAGHAGTITIGCTGNWSTAHNSHNDSTNRIGYELEGISVVYGGANRAAVTSDSIKLTISSGIVDSVFGGNNQSGIISGKIQVNIDKTGTCDWYVGHVFGGGNHARYNDTTEVNIKVGTVTYNVFGGGNDITTDDNTNTDVGAARSKVNMSGGIVKGDLYGGCNTKGTVAIDTKVTLTNGTVEGSVYGGGLGVATQVQNGSTVDISGTNTRVDHDVYGGGNEGQVKGGTDVKIH